MTNTRRGKGKTVILLGVLLAVAGVTLGFAAFSNTLTIKSSATVTPDSSTFKVVFVGDGNNEVSGSVYADEGILEGTSATNAIINNIGNPTLSGHQIVFTKPKQWAEYMFDIRNEGEYDAYLIEINFKNVEGKNSPVVCTAKIDENGNPLATQSLVDETCKYIQQSLLYFIPDEVNPVEITPGVTLAKGERLGAFLAIEYRSHFGEEVVLADGPFTVEFGDIELVWSTVASE